MTENLSPWICNWKNFRGYRDSRDISFPAMTLLIGRNNVGKTSAYAPLLLLRQTLSARSEKTALLLRGDLADYGTYIDLVSDHDITKDILFEIDFGEVTHPEVTHSARRLELQFRYDDEHKVIELARSVVQDADGRPVISRSLQPDKRYKVTSRLLPENNQVGRPYKEVTLLRRGMADEAPANFLFSGVGGLRIPANWREDKARWEALQGWYRAASDLYDMYWVFNGHVRRALEEIAYIGPLRSAPKRTYPISAEPPTDVGRDGEWATELLYRASLNDADRSVLERTNKWLSRLGYGPISFTPGGDYFQASVTKPGTDLSVNIADCGVGLSQLLPLLVQGCIMVPGETLIAQQPEIHLNPAQQDILTDFLIELAHTGRRVIIETHSEHVLGRLRRRVAEGETLESDKVAIYYCENEAGATRLRRIPLGRLGQIDRQSWPSGFFAEQLNNTVEMAMAQARAERTENV